MQEISSFRIERNGGEERESLLVNEALGVSIPVAGSCVEAEFGLDDGRYLVWVGDRQGYDSFLEIFLLDAGGGLLDRIEAGASMADGMLRIVRMDKSSVWFCFFLNEIVYQLRVESEARLRLPLPWGFRYGGSRLRHFLTVREAGREGVHG